MARVIHVSSAHHLLDTRIFYRMARSLAADGHEVTVAAAAPPDSTVPPSLDGVRLIALPPRAGRMARFLRRPFDILRAIRADRYDLVHFHDPDLLPWMLALRLSGRRIVYDAHEAYRDNIAGKTWIPAPLRWLARAGVVALEGLAARWLDGVVAASQPILDKIAPRRGAVVRNFMSKDLALEIGAPPIAERAPAICYFGSVTADRAAVEMVEAFVLVRAARPDCRVVVGGRIAEDVDAARLRERMAAAGVEYVSFLQQREMLDAISACRLGLCLYKPTPAYLEGEYPTKLLDYICVGTPTVTGAGLPNAVALVERLRCGAVADQESPADIARVVLDLLDDTARLQTMSDAGRRAFLDELNWDHARANLRRLYDAILR
ncbi:MAG: glycosyltransferase family 4 protein [Rhodospirillales bacterium]|nr:MAG: glycosyltransferase family 4 protein [Rhodospirillales bacterium]